MVASEQYLYQTIVQFDKQYYAENLQLHILLLPPSGILFEVLRIISILKFNETKLFLQL